MSIKIIIKFIFLLFFFVVTAELKAQFTYTIENGTIPPDFGKNENDVLIFVLHGGEEKVYDKYLKKHVEKNYHGKYIFVSSQEKHSGQYADTSIYKFAFDMRNIERTGGQGSSFFARTFFMVDRKTWKRYGNSSTHTLWSKMLEAYIMAMEKVRLENQVKK